MLVELAIQDFAIIDQLRVGFEPGFNALTGETGAGKSILIDALGAVLGDRVGADMVRAGAKLARIEATFDLCEADGRTDVLAVLEELGIEADEGTLILSREINANGRSSARINGRAATAAMLTQIGRRLVDIHGQSDHLSLLRPAEQLDMLDRFAGTLAARGELAQLVDELRAIERRINDVLAHARERAQRADLLRFQVDEIDAAALAPGEEEELLAERSVLTNAERLAEDAGAAYALLVGDDTDYDGTGPAAVLVGLQEAGRRLADIGRLDERLRPLSERVEELTYLLQDVAAETREYRDRVEADPARLEVVEDRLALLKQLQRKYGASIDDILTYREQAAAELDELTGEGADVDSLQVRADELRREIGRRATELTTRRTEAGDRLAQAVEQAIAELNMGRAVFAVQIAQQADPHGVPVGAGPEAERVAVDRTGADRVEFQIATNAGEVLKPLAKVVSGGETARLMLALKSILSEADETPTLVFDEVDVGVGGRSGQVVGEKLWMLTGTHQVLVITHLPQIAAFADAHYLIRKQEQSGRVVSRVEPMEEAARIDELAAMLDGLPLSPAAQQNAREMMERTRRWKENVRSAAVGS